MGNCQAAEIAAAVVEYPGGRVERVVDLQSAVSAQRLMSAYPGHFVALISSSIVHPPSVNSAPATATPSVNLHAPSCSSPSFKLLAADAPLRSGHRYRLLSFEEVLTSFSQHGGATYANLGRSEIANDSNGRLDVNKHPPHLNLNEGRAHSLNNHVVKIGC